MKKRIIAVILIIAIYLIAGCGVFSAVTSVEAKSPEIQQEFGILYSDKIDGVGYIYVVVHYPTNMVYSFSNRNSGLTPMVSPNGGYLTLDEYISYSTEFQNIN